MEARLEAIDKRIDKMDEVLEKVRERPPLWATWVMTVGGAVIGALVTWLIECMKP